MYSIVSPLLRNQVTQDNQQSGMGQLVALHHVLDLGINASVLSESLTMSADERYNLREAWVHVILSSLEITEQTMLFAKDDVSPIEVFLVNLHREFHLDVESASGDTTIISPVVAKDLTAFYFLFEGAGVPIKIMDFIKNGDEYHVSIVNTAIMSPDELYKQSHAIDMGTLQSLCVWAKTREYRSDPFKSALMDIILNMS